MLWYIPQRLTLPDALSAAQLAALVASHVVFRTSALIQLFEPHCQSSVTYPQRWAGAKPSIESVADIMAVELITDQSASQPRGIGHDSLFSMHEGDGSVAEAAPNTNAHIAMYCDGHY
jgi:hypothetical protein